MAGEFLASLQNSPPSYQMSAASGARSDSGSIYGGFSSGNFTVGGSDSSIKWLFIIGGLVLVAMFFFKGKQK